MYGSRKRRRLRLVTFAVEETSLLMELIDTEQQQQQQQQQTTNDGSVHSPNNRQHNQHLSTTTTAVDATAMSDSDNNADMDATIITQEEHGDNSGDSS